VAEVFDRPVFNRARRLCLALPETSERASWGHPNFRVGRKVFCAFEVVKGRPSIAFKLSAPDRKVAERKRNFFSTPYGRGLWVSTWVDRAVDWRLIARLIDRSYRCVADKRLVNMLNTLNGGDKRSRRTRTRSLRH
jgi:predicted DNA-binding protein (MmcQ/YjbR family)